MITGDESRQLIDSDVEGANKKDRVFDNDQLRVSGNGHSAEEVQIRQDWVGKVNN